MSYKKIVLELTDLLLSNSEVGAVGAGFEDQREEFITKNRKFVSAWITEPKGGGVLNVTKLSIEVILTDLLLDSRANEIDVISDLHLILEDLKAELYDGNYEDFDLVNFTYSTTAGNTTGEEAIDVRGVFEFDLTNNNIC